MPKKRRSLKRRSSDEENVNSSSSSKKPRTTDIRAGKGKSSLQTWKWFHKHVVPLPDPQIDPKTSFPKFTTKSRGTKRIFKGEIKKFKEELFGEDKPWQVVNTPYGHGLRLTGSLNKVLDEIRGSVEPLDEAESERLRRQKHPSLIGLIGGGCGQLIGPLSLVNHHCQSPFEFSLIDNHTARLQYRNHTDATLADSVVGEEITACYTDKELLNFECKCSACTREEEGKVAPWVEQWVDSETALSEEEYEEETEEEDTDVEVIESEDEQATDEECQPPSPVLTSLRRLLSKQTLLAGGQDQQEGGPIPRSIATTYNHLDQYSMQRIINEFPEEGELTEGPPIFMDLGSGYGAAVMYFAATHPGVRCTGIEYLQQRVDMSETICAQLNESYGERLRNVQFLQGDIVLDHRNEILQATHIWSYDAVYLPEQTLKPLFGLLSESEKLWVLVSFQTKRILNQYATGRKFKLIATVRV